MPPVDDKNLKDLAYCADQDGCAPSPPMGWKKPPLDPDAPIVGASHGDRIVAARQRAGLSKTALAERVGRTWGTVNNWETNATEPSGTDFKRIAEATGVQVEELLGIADGQEPPFEAWREFLDTSVAKGLTRDERRTLAGIPWKGIEPTVDSYLMAAAAVRAAKRKQP